MSECLATSHPAIAAFQPHNLQTIFPPKQDVDLASIQREIDELKQDNRRQDEMIVELKQKVGEHDQKILEQDRKILELSEDSCCHRHQSGVEQLQSMNTSMIKRVASLEEERKGFEEISYNLLALLVRSFGARLFESFQVQHLHFAPLAIKLHSHGAHPDHPVFDASSGGLMKTGGPSCRSCANQYYKQKGSCHAHLSFPSSNVYDLPVLIDSTSRC